MKKNIAGILVKTTIWLGLMAVWLQLGNGWVWKKSDVYSEVALMLWIASQVTGNASIQHMRAGD